MWPLVHQHGNAFLLCPSSEPGATAYKYSMEQHWWSGHPEAVITAAIKETFETSASERRWPRAKWDKAAKKKRQSESRVVAAATAGEPVAS